MIKENELRIGNRLLYHINEDGIEWDVCTVDWQDLKWISQDQDGFNQNHKPIPLTEEVLKAWGFELSDDNGDVKHYEIGKYGIRMFEDSDFYFYHKMQNENEYWILRELNFFHEVQNLYFALTGDELKPINN